MNTPAALERAAALLSAVSDVHARFLADADLAETFERLLRTLIEITASEHGLLGEVFVDPDGRPVLRCYAISALSWNDERRGEYAERVRAGLEFRDLESPFGRVLATGRHVLANDAPAAPALSGFPPGHPPLQSFLGLPIRHNGRMVGMAGVANRPGGYDGSLVTELEPFLTSLGALIEMVRSDRRRHDAEEALRRSEERWALALRANRDGIWDWTIATDRVWYSPRWRSMLGDEEEELYGDPTQWSSRVHPDDLERVWADMQAHLDGRAPTYTSVYRLRHRAGHYLWILARGVATRDAAGRAVRVVGSHSDITAERMAEDDLRAERRRFQTLVDSIDGIVWEAELDPLAFTFVSQHAEHVLGYPVSDWYTPEFWERHLHPDDREPTLAECREACRLGRNHTLEYRLIAADGRTVWIHDVVTVVVEGDRIRLRGVMLDTTERHRDEMARRALEARVQQSHRLQELGTLAGGIAHDFNNVLAGILGNAELATHELAFAHPAAEMLREIVTGATRARDLVRQILTFSRPAEHQRVPLDLGDAAEEALKLLSRSIPATIAIARTSSPERISVLADPAQLSQAIVNLCTNAAQAMEAGGGRLSVDTSRVVVDHEAPLDAGLAPGRYGCVTVRDTGPGMDAALVDRIFAPFFTTKPPGRGTGLGLSVVHGIMRAHGGAVTVRSEPGRGSEFRLYFPAIEQPFQAAAAASPQSLVGGQDEHVLLVDDEDAIVRMGTRMLERLGYRVTSAQSAGAALDRFRASPHRFAAVLTDLTMPGQSGTALATELRAVRADLPIILTTGYGGSVDEAEVRRAGIAAVLSKPFLMTSLSSTLRRVLDERSA